MVRTATAAKMPFETTGRSLMAPAAEDATVPADADIRARPDVAPALIATTLSDDTRPEARQAPAPAAPQAPEAAVPTPAAADTAAVGPAAAALPTGFMAVPDTAAPVSVPAPVTAAPRRPVAVANAPMSPPEPAPAAGNGNAPPAPDTPVIAAPPPAPHAPVAAAVTPVVLPEQALPENVRQPVPPLARTGEKPLAAAAPNADSARVADRGDTSAANAQGAVPPRNVSKRAASTPPVLTMPQDSASTAGPLVASPSPAMAAAAPGGVPVAVLDRAASLASAARPSAPAIIADSVDAASLTDVAPAVPFSPTVVRTLSGEASPPPAPAAPLAPPLTARPGRAAPSADRAAARQDAPQSADAAVAPMTADAAAPARPPLPATAPEPRATAQLARAIREVVTTLDFAPGATVPAAAALTPPAPVRTAEGLSARQDLPPAQLPPSALPPVPERRPETIAAPQATPAEAMPGPAAGREPAQPAPTATAQPARGTALPSAQPALPAMTPSPRPPAPAASPGARQAAQVFAAAMFVADRPAPRTTATVTDVADLFALTGMAAPGAGLAVGAAANAQQPALDMRQPDWPATMIERIEVLRDAAEANVRETRIRLVPDALGPVDVAIRQDGEATTVRLTAETPQARAMLAEAAPRLTELADARGLKLSQSTFDTGASGFAGRHPQQQQPQPEQPARPAPAPERTTEAAAADTDDQRIA